MTGLDEKLRPASAVADAVRRPERVRDWIVIGQPDVLAAQPPGQGRMAGRSLPLIDGRALRASYAQARAMAEHPGVTLLWAYDSDLFEPVVGVISGLEYALRNGARVASLSMGPPKAVAALMRHDPDEPLNRATRAATDAGMVVVIAIGNYGPEEGVVNPWCADWTINVGAADAKGTALAPFSARGRPGDTDRPTLVAPGIDVLTIHPGTRPKTDADLARETGSPTFHDIVPPDLRDLHTVVSGTSFATPQVAEMAGQIVWCLDHQRRLAQAGWQKSVAVPLRGMPGFGRQFPRLAGTLGPDIAVYPVEAFEGPMRGRMVKQILIDLARSVPGCLPHQIGAGFVHSAIIKAAFSDFEIPPTRIMAVKAFNA